MSTVTLDDIKATQARLAEMIANLEAHQQARSFYLPATTIDLLPGERYAGIVLGHDAEASYHLILLPGDAEGLTHKAALKWAADTGGELPSRREQTLLYANLKSEFKESWYWSAQLHKSDPDYAWSQSFFSGIQLINSRNHAFRARAVRRLIIQ